MTTLINQNPVIYETADSNRAWRDDDNDNEASLDPIDAQEVFGNEEHLANQLPLRRSASPCHPNSFD